MMATSEHSLSSLSTLPSFFRYLPDAGRKPLEECIHNLLSPFLELESLLHKKFLAFVPEEDGYLETLRKLLGMNHLAWDQESLLKLVPHFADYLHVRGTRKGVELLLGVLLPNVKVNILERFAPFNSFNLSSSRLSSEARITDFRHEARSLVLDFQVEKSALSSEGLDRFTEILRGEVPSGLTVYFKFRADPRSKKTPSSWPVVIGSSRLSKETLK